MVLVVVVFRVSWDAIYSFRTISAHRNAWEMILQTQLARKGSNAEIYARFSRSNDSLPSLRKSIGADVLFVQLGGIYIWYLLV